MEGEVRNYGYFYSMLRFMPYEGDREDLKKELVLDVTCGRTASLRELSDAEYHQLCSRMRAVCPKVEKSDASDRRYWRSVCLKLFQQIGVDTTSWTAINAYCRSPKIAGTDFRNLDVATLEKLSLKLRMIKKKKREKH